MTQPALLLVAASSPRRVRIVAQVRGIDPKRTVMVTGPYTIDQHPGVPLVIDSSWSGHPMYRALQGVLADAISDRIGREPNRRGARHRP